MSPRIKGRSYRQTKPQPATVRHEQLREQLRAGQSDPAAIAKVLGCSKELVLYHARRMTDVELRQEHQTGRRWRIQVFLLPAAAVAA
ncbi:hypothetical protein [Gemmatimonas sp.]|jgi:hypothetical protein|uniref:hypothetical protein n=1 Tax=Gemmatimonas sp. TaxID=1962908 RepID=UPI0037C0AE58